jgi:hypothetical protein
MDGLRLRREAIFFVTSTFASWISFRTRIREIGNDVGQGGLRVAVHRPMAISLSCQNIVISKGSRPIESTLMARRYGSANASARPSALLADPLDKFKMLNPHRGRTTASRLKHLTAGKKFGKWQVAWVGYYSTDVSTPVPGYLKQSADVIDAARTGSASGTCVDRIIVLGEAHL